MGTPFRFDHNQQLLTPDDLSKDQQSSRRDPSCPHSQPQSHNRQNYQPQAPLTAPLHSGSQMDDTQTVIDAHMPG